MTRRCIEPGCRRSARTSPAGTVHANCDIHERLALGSAFGASALPLAGQYPLAGQRSGRPPVPASVTPHQLA